MKTDRQKLYSSLTKRDHTVKIKVPYCPLLLAVLGQYNALLDIDKPDLNEVQAVKDMLKGKFNINL